MGFVRRPIFHAFISALPCPAAAAAPALPARLPFSRPTTSVSSFYPTFQTTMLKVNGVRELLLSRIFAHPHSSYVRVFSSFCCGCCRKPNSYVFSSHLQRPFCSTCVRPNFWAAYFFSIFCRQTKKSSLPLSPFSLSVDQFLMYATRIFFGALVYPLK